MDKNENYQLRKLLWLNHGCPIRSLYGDDGEMQCNDCLIDFKRDTVEEIERHLTSAMHTDGKSSAVFEENEYTVDYVDSETIRLTRRR